MASSTIGLPAADNASALHAIKIHYRYKQAGDVKVFYREAGDPKSPTLLMLHGFAGSSFMFRDLIAQLADRYHLIAPDLPGFGYTEAPERANMLIPLTILPRQLISSLKNLISIPMR